MISIIQCHGCVHLDFNYETGVASVQKPCHGCCITTAGTPSNYEPARLTVTSVQPIRHGDCVMDYKIERTAVPEIKEKGDENAC